MFSLEPKTLHIWTASLDNHANKLKFYSGLLSPDEMARAKRFHFPIHKERFIITRGILRQLLQHYLNIPAAHLSFFYNSHGKPYLNIDSVTLQFNASHSEDRAVFAFTLNQTVGIDLEKIKLDEKLALAERFFNPAEHQQLLALPQSEQINAFYQIWTRKEAIIKAIGKGLALPLASFCVSLNKREHLTVEDKVWQVENFSSFSQFASAFAVQDGVTKILLRDFTLSYPEE